MIQSKMDWESEENSVNDDFDQWQAHGCTCHLFHAFAFATCQERKESEDFDFSLPLKELILPGMINKM